MISVNDIVLQALPPQTAIIAGKAGLGREVTWATRIRPTPPAFDNLSGGEIVLLPPQVLEMLDERLTLDEAIRQLAAFGVAAVALSTRADVAARQMADEANLPLLELPHGLDFGALEREASRFITDRRRQLQQRGQEVGRQLMELAIAGESPAAIIQEMAQLSGRVVIFEGRDGLSIAVKGEHPDLPNDLLTELLTETRSTVEAWLRSVAATSSAEPPTAMYPASRAWQRIVAPVIGRDGLLGNISLFVPAKEGALEDGIIAWRGAAACAVTMAREQAAASARREIELNVLDEILDGALRSEVSLLQQAERLGHTLTNPHCALIARVDPVQGAPSRARMGRWSSLESALHRITKTHDTPLLWRVRNTTAELVWPVEDDTDVQPMVRSIREELSRASGLQSSAEVISIGTGRVRSGLTGIRQSHQEARQALTLGRRLHGTGHTTAFDDLGVYRLIYAAEQLPELRMFQEEALGTLGDYDRAHNSELIGTLEAFFQANCSPKEAASILHVHRNTVLYRLERIADITGLDLNASDVRLRLHLALHVRLALHA